MRWVVSRVMVGDGHGGVVGRNRVELCVRRIVGIATLRDLCASANVEE